MKKKKKEIENNIDILKEYEKKAIDNKQFIKAMRYHRRRLRLENIIKENKNDINEINT